MEKRTETQPDKSSGVQRMGKYKKKKKKKILPHLLSCLKPLRTNVLKFNGLQVQF